MRPRSGTATADTTRWPTSCTMQPRKRACIHRERKGRRPQALTAPPTCGCRIEKTRFWKLGIRQSHPAFAPPLATVKNVVDYESSLKRTFHNKASRCHDNGRRFTSVVFGQHVPRGEIPRSACSPGSHNVSVPPLIAHSTSISTWPSAPLHHSSVTPREPS